MMAMGRPKKRTIKLPKMAGKQRMKHRNVTLKFTTITGMMRIITKTRRALNLKKRKIQNQKSIRNTIQTKERKKLKRMKGL